MPLTALLSKTLEQTINLQRPYVSLLVICLIGVVITHTFLPLKLASLLLITKSELLATLY